jgi:16S rRNA A1518/A1519 N6-dimethyltransferase RsmA/KsgA/DIM1 with predicted DNA glycosylase/AP lyase activity
LIKRDRSEIDSFLQAQDIDPKRRGETLSVEEFIKLARAARARSIDWQLVTDY